MKKTLILGGVAAIFTTMTSCLGSGSEPKNFADSLAYYSGIEVGSQLNQNYNNMPEEYRKDFDRDEFLKGLKTVLDGDTAKKADAYYQGLGFGLQLMQQMRMYEKAGIDYNRDLFFSEFKKAFKADSVNIVLLDSVGNTLMPLQARAQTILQNYQIMEMQRAQEETKKKFEENKKAGEAFMKKQLAADPSIKVTPSGLAYKVTKAGTGAVAQKSDELKVIYTGRLIDGTEFDSSKGQPAPFRPDRVVPGFGEALTTLPAGTKATIYIPENLGYGQQEMGVIKPGSTLVFDIEIVEVTPQEEKAAEKAAVKAAVKAAANGTPAPAGKK